MVFSAAKLIRLSMSVSWLDCRTTRHRQNNMTVPVPNIQFPVCNATETSYKICSLLVLCSSQSFDQISNQMTLQSFVQCDASTLHPWATNTILLICVHWSFTK